uniref:SUI1 domain-containing protein n=1 Tax=Scleropages formosus TaxID=113540 RepID=A0A8C9RAA9_SCLFO
GSLILQHNSHKMLATAQGIAHDYKKKKLVKAFKKLEVAHGVWEVIQLQGDQRKNICQFLLQILKLLHLRQILSPYLEGACCPFP